MIRTWIFLQNPFFNCTKKNYKKAVKISTYTDNQLLTKIADPFYAPLYAAYHPLHVALVAAYNTWKAQGGTQKGSTVTLVDLLAQLSPSKSGLWNRAVQLLYPVGSAIYVAIFPKKMKPFNSGTQTEKINAVAQLEIALTGKAPLATTLADVSAFSVSLIAAEATQSGNIGGTATASTNVETARVNAMVMLYAIPPTLRIELQKMANDCTFDTQREIGRFKIGVHSPSAIQVGMYLDSTKKFVGLCCNNWRH